MVGELDKSGTVLLSGSIYAVLAFLFLFYPLAGCLADIRWGRYKTIINSLCFTFWGLLSVIVLGGLAAVLVTMPTFLSADSNYDESKQQLIIIAIGVIAFILFLMAAFGGFFFSIWSYCIQC